MEYSGARMTLIHEKKTEVENLMSDSLKVRLLTKLYWYANTNFLWLVTNWLT